MKAISFSEGVRSAGLGLVAALGLVVTAAAACQIIFPEYTAVIIVGALIAVGCSAHPVKTAVAFLALLPLVLWLGQAPIASGGGPLLHLQIKGGLKAVLAAAALLCVLRYRSGLRNQAVIGTTLGLYAFLLGSCMYSPNHSFSLRAWFGYVPGLALYLLVSRGTDAAHTLRAVMIGFCGSGVVGAAIGLAQLVGWAPAEEIMGLARIDGGFEHPNQLAMCLLVVILGIVHVGIPTGSGLRSAHLLPVLFVALLLMFLTFSRTGWVVLAGSLALSFFLTRGKRYVPLTVACIAGLLTWGLVGSLVLQRLEPNSSSGMRLKLVGVGLEMWPERPVLGHGFGAFSLLSQDFLGTVTAQYGTPIGLAPHNDVLRSLVEGGLVGVLFYAVMMGALLGLGLALRRREGAAGAVGSYLACLTVAVVAFGLAAQGLYYGGPYLLALAGVAEVFRREARA